MKNTFQINKYFRFLLVFGTFIASQIVFANDGLFQNNLLKMDVNKTSQGSVKVTLFTTKPYGDSVVVNKKSDKEYVILMPETASSMTAKPSFKNASDVVQNIEVKTQQYNPSQNQKGYTKITFSTTKPIEITPQIQTAKTEYKLSEKEYKELMSQTAKKQAVAVKPNQSQVTKKAEKLASAPRPEKIVLRSYNEPTKKASKQTVKKEATKKTVTKPVVPAKKKVVEQKVSQPAAVQTQKAQMQPKEKAAPPMQKVEQVKEEKAPIQTIQTQVKPETKIIPPIAPTNIVPAETPQKPLRKYQKLINKVKNNYALGFGILLIPILLLILLFRGASRTVKKMQQQKAIFTSNLKEKPSTPVDFSEKINEDMNWKEKFQAYEETKNQVEAEETTQEPELVPSESADIDELFGLEGLEANEIEEISEEPSSLDEFIQEPYTEETEISADELFGEEEEEKFDEEYFEIEEAEADQLILSSFKIDNERGFYLVDFEGTTALVGHIGEEIFVLKRFDRLIRGSIQARLNERLAAADNYLIKIDGFKALVEVTSYSMKLLIEL